MTISIDKVRPGMVIAENIFQNEGDKIPIIFANVQLNERQIDQLKSKGRQFIKVKFKKDVEETVSDELQEIAMQSVKNFDIQKTIESAQTIVAKITREKYLAYDLSKYALQTQDVYQHAVDVCCFAVALGKVYNFKKLAPEETIDINNLAVAALLHEVGTVCTDEKTLDQIKFDRPLDKSIFPGYYDCFKKFDPSMVPVYSYATLKDNPVVESSIKLAILLHDEDFVQEGPLKVNKEFINRNNNGGVVMAKILHVCNIYDMLLNKVIKRHITPSNIIEIMNYMKTNGKLDKEITDLFMKNIPLYQIGTVIQLSDGSIAKVVEINEKSLDRPKIMIEGQNNIIDLSDSVSLTIKDICEYNLDKTVSSEKIR